MIIVNANEFPHDEPHAVVDQDRCDGCALCVSVCPKECLTIVANQQMPGHRIVVVGAKACSGCGACQGTCPKEAISIPGLSVPEIKAFVKQAIELSI